MAQASTMSKLATWGGTFITGVVIGPIGAIFGPGFDVPQIIVVWATMFAIIADETGHHFDRKSRLRIVTGVVGGIGLALTGIKLGVQAAALTGIGTGPAIIANCSLNASMTWIFARQTRLILENMRDGESEADLVQQLLCAFLAAIGFAPASGGDAASH